MRCSTMPRAIRASRRSAFSLIELLVVLAIILLLLSITLPGMSRAREQGKRTFCLSNLRSVSQGAAEYASEDSRDFLIPIHVSMVTPAPAAEYWLRRCAMWFSYGGRSGQQPFMTAAGPDMLDEPDFWAAGTRPLNRYLYGDLMESDERTMPLYECPSDQGYPLHAEIDDSPPENARRRCYDTIGNSYRASLYGLFPEPGEAYRGAFAVGPWGHRLSTIPDVSRTIAFGEPTFFNMIGMDNGVANPPAVIAWGWHRDYMTDNLAYCDGSARKTRAIGHQTVEEHAAREGMDVGDNWTLISRGPGWRFDLWPTHGARIFAENPEDLLWNPPYSAQGERAQFWPFVRAENNLHENP